MGVCTHTVYCMCSYYFGTGKHVLCMYVCACVRVRACVRVCMCVCCVSGLKLGQVIQVTFCLSQVDLTQYIKYPNLIQILH